MGRSVTAALLVLLWAVAASAGPLPTPHITQRAPAGRPPSWHGEQRCGPACLTMVARSHGQGGTSTDAMLMHRIDRLDGAVNQPTTWRDMVGAAHAMQLDTHEAHGWTFERASWVYRNLGNGHDVIVLGNPSMLPGSASFRPGAGHYVLVSGVDPHGNFVVHDPWAVRPYTLTHTQLGRFVSSFMQSSTGGSMMALRSPN